MKRITRFSLVATLLSVPLASWQVWAVNQDALSSSTLDGGGGISVGTEFTVHGTAGQPDAGSSTGSPSGFEVRGGFWNGKRVATSVDGPVSVGRHELQTPVPNPFNPQTSIRFDLAAETRVRVEVIDIRGRLVRRLLDETRPAGSHEFVWKGRADDGSAVASGVYFLRLSADGQVRTQKMTLLK